MKKLLFILPLALLAISCDNSIESKIENEFEEYVQQNFDNPDNVKEIVSVEANDTVSYESLCVTMMKATDLVDMCYQTYKEDLSKSKDVLNTINNAPKYKFYGDMTLAYMAMDLITKTDEFEKFVDNVFIAEAEELLEKKLLLTDNSIASKSYPNIFEYIIKYRIKEGDDLVIREYYCYATNVNDEEVFQSHLLQINEISEYDKTLGEIVNTAIKAGELYNDYETKKNAFFESCDKTESYILSKIN